MQQNLLLIVDGSGYIFRSYYAIPKTMMIDGVLINAAYGFCFSILKLINDLKPNYFAIVFDAGKRTFRHRLDPNYKTHRPSVPIDLIAQFSIIDNFVDALNIVKFKKTGFEADDIIGTLIKRIHSLLVKLIWKDYTNFLVCRR